MFAAPPPNDFSKNPNCWKMGLAPDEGMSRLSLDVFKRRLDCRDSVTLSWDLCCCNLSPSPPSCPATGGVVQAPGPGPPLRYWGGRGSFGSPCCEVGVKITAASFCVTSREAPDKAACRTPTARVYLLVGGK